MQHWGIKQAGICLRCESEEVLRLRNTVIRPPLELSEALEAPGEGKAQGNLIRHNTFSAQLPHHSVVLKESQQSSLRGGKKQQPEETKTSRSPRCASVALKQTSLKKLPSCKIPTVRWSESALTSNISDSQVEERKLAYEAHINRKNAYPEITRIKSLGDINRQLQTSLDSVQMLAVNSPAVEVCGTTSKASYSFWCEGEIVWFLKI